MRYHHLLLQIRSSARVVDCLLFLFFSMCYFALVFGFGDVLIGVHQ